MGNSGIKMKEVPKHIFDQYLESLNI